jgi:predicted pyridoxine 5'-phosphate oxidase superfamily flavin-nucleotide-binding protein
MGILTEDMQRLVREQRLAFVASVSADGTPSLSPKATTLVYDPDHLAYLDIASPGTRANIAANPAVEVNVIDHILRRGYRFKGRAKFLDKGAEYERAMMLFGTHSTLLSRSKGVVLIRVTRALPLLSPAYAAGRNAAELAAEFSEYYNKLAAERVSRSVQSPGNE